MAVVRQVVTDLGDLHRLVDVVAQGAAVAAIDPTAPRPSAADVARVLDAASDLIGDAYHALRDALPPEAAK